MRQSRKSGLESTCLNLQGMFEDQKRWKQQRCLWPLSAGSFCARMAPKSSSSGYGGIYEAFPPYRCLRRSKCKLLSGFDQLAILGFELQLAHRAFSELNVIAHFAEVFCLDELSIGSRMAVEVTHFHNLLHAREWIAVWHSHRAHETRPISIQEVHGNGAMAVVRLLVGLRANDEGCRSDKLT